MDLVGLGQLPLSTLSIDLGSFTQFLSSGLVQGCIYALVALGFVVLARVTGVLNFATGEYVMLGGMLMAALTNGDVPLALAVPTTVVAVALIGVAQERLTLAPVRNANVITLAIITFGVSAVLRGGALLIWGTTPRRVPVFSSEGSFSLLGARLQWQSAWVVGATVVLFLLFFLFFKYTTLGRAMRACSDNPMAARLMGVRLSRMSLLAFAIAAGVAALGGAVITPLSAVDYDTGVLLGLKGFVAALMAGFISAPAAVAAGLSLGVAEALGAAYISSAWKDAITFVILLIYLFAQHFGLFAPPRQQLARLEHGFHQFHLRRSLGRASAVATAPFRAAPPVAAPAAKEEPLWQRWLWLPAFAVLILLFPLVPFIGGYLEGVAIVAGVGAIGAIGLCLIMGYAGQLNLGFAGWLIIGGYTSGILTVNYSWPAEAALVMSIVLSGVIAYLVGKVSLRLQGFQLAAATLAVQFIMAVVVHQWKSETGGGTGLFGIKAFQLFGLDLRGTAEYFYFIWAVVIVCLIVGLNIDRSRTGRALRALAASEPAALSLAVDAGRYKLQMFILSSMMAGVAGSLYAHYLRYISPTSFSFDLTIAMISFAVVGGMRTVWGGVVGAIVVTTVRELVREVGTQVGGADTPVYQVIVIGLLLVAVLMFAPDGIVSKLSQGTAWLRSRLGLGRPPAGTTQAVLADPAALGEGG
jgi:branched-chain amino acid transport system permease protein